MPDGVLEGGCSGGRAVLEDPAAFASAVIVGVAIIVGVVGSLLVRQVHLGRLGVIIIASCSGSTSTHSLVIDPRKANLPKVNLGGVADGGQNVAAGCRCCS